MMTTLDRFDWDILLEKDPANPPAKEEAPLPPIEVEQETVVLSPPTKPKAVPEIKLPPAHNHKTKQPKRVPQPSPPNVQSSGDGETGILQGNLTSQGILNGFVLAELLGKPKGLQYRNRFRRY